MNKILKINVLIFLTVCLCVINSLDAVICAECHVDLPER